MPVEKVRVAMTSEFAKRPCIKFALKPRGEGFVVFWQNEYHAYLNVCCHTPLPLDYGDGDFLSPDGKFLLCRNHGAEYDPATGRCVRGPCQGASLSRLPVTVEDGVVWININQGGEDAIE